MTTPDEAKLAKAAMIGVVRAMLIHDKTPPRIVKILQAAYRHANTDDERESKFARLYQDMMRDALRGAFATRNKRSIRSKSSKRRRS